MRVFKRSYDKVMHQMKQSSEHLPLSSDGGALDSSSALSSGMTSWTGTISGYLLISWIVVGGAFLTGLAMTVDGTGLGGCTTSFTWGQDGQLKFTQQTDKVMFSSQIIVFYSQAVGRI